MRPWMKERIENGEPLKGDFDGQQGRWPANLVHDGSDEVVAGFPTTGKSTGGRSGHTGAYDGGYLQAYYGATKPGFGDSGSAARFFAELAYDDDDLAFMHWFYGAKASKQDRDEGLEGWEGKMQLRADLTTEQRAYVMAELKRCGVNL
jgi:site-specific DNA-methyltransferase (adenine-specific)